MICFDNSYNFINNFFKYDKNISKKQAILLYKNNINCCTHMSTIVGYKSVKCKINYIIVQDNLGKKFINGKYKINCKYLKTFCHYIVIQGE